MPSASETDYLDWYDDMPTDYSQYVPSDPTDYSQYAPSNPTGSGNSGNSDNSDNSDNSNNAVMTDAPSMPSGPAVDIPPPSIQSVLITAVPASYLSQMANPSARSSLINEIQHGNYPSWYDDLPGNVKSWIHDHYASATGFGASPTDGAGSDSGPHGPVPGAAPPSGVIATGLLGAAGILAAAVML